MSIESPKKPNILHPASSVVQVESQGARCIAAAKGVTVTDESGHQLLDGIAGLWCSNLGHGREELAEALKSATIQLDYFHTFNAHTNQAQEKLSERLVAMAPEGLSKVFFGCSGSDANDTLIKIAWQYQIIRGKPEKRKIISRWQSYHGTSISTASLTGLKGFHKAFNLPLDFAIHTDAPFYYRDALPGETEADFTQRLLTNLEALIAKEGADNIAAFIGEPIMGAGGVITPPQGYWEGVQRICRENDILIIADEVVSGFGRTGANFACEHYQIKPDMMTTAKGITAGVFPFSAAFISEDIYQVLKQASQELGGFSHGYTYSGHPVGAALANRVLDIMEDESITQNAKQVGEYLHQQLNNTLAEHPNVAEIRGKGLVAAIQLIKDKEAKTFFDPAEKIAANISEDCYQKGLIIRPLPSISSLALSPPLVLTRKDVDQMVAIVKSSIEGFFNDLDE